MKPTLLVLAAGMGSRYGGLKQIEPVGPGGETLLDYAVYDALRAGFGKAVFVIRRDIEADFRATIGDRLARHVEVGYAFQELDEVPEGVQAPEGRKKPWGTAHAVWSARDAIAGPFASINADDHYGASSYRLLHDFLTGVGGRAAHYALVGYRLDRTLSPHGSVARGLCQTGAGGALESIEEHTRISKAEGGAVSRREGRAPLALTGGEPVSMNMWGFTPAIFAQLERYLVDYFARPEAAAGGEALLPAAVNTLVQQGAARVDVLPSPEAWHGVTYREDRPALVAALRHMVAEGLYPETLWP